MKDIRKYIDENREQFDDKELPAGHMERFEALLKNQEKPVEKIPAKRVRLISIISVAAAIAVLCLLAIKVYIPNNVNITPGLEGTEIETESFQATNEHYDELMQQKIADIMCKLAYTDQENQALLTADLEELMKSHTEFVKEMAHNENKEIAMHYLINHYKTNIQVLDNINEKLGKYTKC